ncbi:MAG TPA: adenylate/guanylate cyclase domain-containing protein [Anaerolineales bacterium]|nr:adenylate/guanylate cyclase domain-containing protein [Anaerolineales bacterium]
METLGELNSPLVDVEARLRNLLPSKLYADVWINPSTRNLTRIFNHLRTVSRIFNDYLPRQVVSSLPKPGFPIFEWVEGTLMFTDLSGFTPLLEKNAEYGKDGADTLLKVLNGYFTEMLQIVSKSGGNLLEFTGDALLVQFPTDQRGSDTTRAVRAGLRMQRAMEPFQNIEMLDETFKMGMRVGIHVGKFLTADIGTPHRMEHVLLGTDVLRAKKAEGSGQVGKVCLSLEAMERVQDEFHFEEHGDDHVLVIDDLSDDDLGDYDIIPSRTRMASMVLFDTSKEGLVTAISDSVNKVEPLASFIPTQILNLLVENASARGIPPDFPEATMLFVNILGLPEYLDEAPEEDQASVITGFSRIVSLINAEIEAQGGVMKKVTYHHAGPDIMAFFGVPVAHTNDTQRAVKAAQEILKIIRLTKDIDFCDETISLTCHIGISTGRVFAGEIGQRQGRREFNVMGNNVNTAARLMDRAEPNQILVTSAVRRQIKDQYQNKRMAGIQLKGRSTKLTLYDLGKEKS